MRPVYLTGIGFFARGFRDLDAFIAGTPDPSVTDCENPWVPTRLGRGTSLVTRMLGGVAAQACARGGADPRTVATIYGSALGEFETMVVLLDTIFRGDGQLSPMRFKNSVHNAASGLGSIGQGNQGFSTALAAGARSFEAAMIEALVLLAEQGGDAIVSVADDALPEPFSALAQTDALAIGLCLRSELPEAGALARLDGLAQREPRAAPPSRFAGRALPGTLGCGAAAAALPLIDAVLTGARGEIALAPGLARPFVVRVGDPT